MPSASDGLATMNAPGRWPKNVLTLRRREFVVLFVGEGRRDEGRETIGGLGQDADC